MDILVCSSKKFFKYLVVMLASLYENNQDINLMVHVMHSELDTVDLNLLKTQAAECNNEINPIEIKAEQFEKLPTRQHWPAVLYFRLLAADLLPDAVERVLSLDIDIIVRKSLRALYETKLENCYIAACEDTLNTTRYKKRLQMPLDSTYFNAGVMLLHLRKMREDNIGLGTFMRVSEEQGPHLTIPDQDLLNLVLAANIQLLDPSCYNCSPSLFEQLYSSNMSPTDPFATIIHYLRPDCKPWNTHVGYIGSDIGDLWWKYAKQTPFYKQLKDDFEGRISGVLIKENLALKTYYDIALRWLQAENRQKKLEDFFLGKHIQTIAIYGLNAFQEILCRDLEGTRLQVKYLIDSYAKGYAFGYEIRNGSHFGDVDAIVVAASAHFREIRSGLDNTCPVLSLDEVIAAIDKI